jgi:hypothetical protein
MGFGVLSDDSLPSCLTISLAVLPDFFLDILLDVPLDVPLMSLEPWFLRCIVNTKGFPLSVRPFRSLRGLC